MRVMRVQRNGESALRSISVVIVDGDSESRRLVARRLRRDPDFRLVGTFRDRAAGVAALRERGPRVIFVGLDGDESEDLEAATAGPGRTLVLLGSSDRDARRAFDLGARDFLRRPLSGQRLHETLDRLRGLRGTASGWSPFPGSEGPFLLRLSALEWVEGNGRRTRLHGGFGSLESTASLATLAPRLREEGFVRISRPILVRTSAVHEVRRATAETWDLVLRSGAVVRSDRDHLAAVEEIIRALRSRP